MNRSNQEMHHLLRDTLDEIIRLRRENEILRAKVEMVELFSNVLFSKPPDRFVLAGPDVTWTLAKVAEDFENLVKQDREGPA